MKYRKQILITKFLVWYSKEQKRKLQMNEEAKYQQHNSNRRQDYDTTTGQIWGPGNQRKDVK
jgi:hypothetical protein